MLGQAEKFQAGCRGKGILGPREHLRGPLAVVFPGAGLATFGNHLQRSEVVEE
jgi:hypothetical protein